MRDQAFRLRELIQTAAPEASTAAPGVPMVVITGARPGVGATTVAVNLAAALADSGERVVLMDAVPRQKPNVAEAAGAARAVEKTVADVLAGACSAAAALAPGPCGCLLLGNRGGGTAPVECSRHAQQRLFAELNSLGSLASVLVVDAGSSLTPWTRRFWLRAALVAVVTTTEDFALIDAYALVKRSAADGIKAPIRVLANQCDSDASAQDASRRVSSACRRFLSRDVPSLPPVPRWIAADSTLVESFPRVWENPNSKFGHAMLWLGSAVKDVLRIEAAGCGGGHWRPPVIAHPAFGTQHSDSGTGGARSHV